MCRVALAVLARPVADLNECAFFGFPDTSHDERLGETRRMPAAVKVNALR
jgi:hypothetical protein